MNKMIVENKRLEKICSFYVSDFHLEMILLPYINEKLEKQEKIEIITEKDLTETIKILVSKMNLNEENKQKILNMNWSKKEKKIDDNTNAIIIGSKEYIQKQNIQIEGNSYSNLSVVNCFDFEEVKDDISSIINSHDKSLNTLGFNNI